MRRQVLVPLIAGLLVLPATAPVAAAAEGCTTWRTDGGRTGNVECTDGGATRQHRAVVTCVNGGGTKWKITGPWRYRNRVSSATCSVSGTAGVYAISQERRNRG